MVLSIGKIAENVMLVSRNPFCFGKVPPHHGRSPRGAFSKRNKGGVGFWRWWAGFGLHGGKFRAEVCSMEKRADEPNTGGSPEAWVTLEGISGHLAVSSDSVRRWIRERDFPAHKAGGVWRFKVSEVDAWVRAGRKGSQV